MQVEGNASGVGSRIRLSGSAFGIDVWVDEVVMDRVFPRHKTWETIGHPRLLVIGPYRMGFSVAALGKGSSLRVFIDYDLPEGIWARCLGRLFGAWYARWCVRQMVTDAVHNFEPRTASAAQVVQ